MAAYGNISITTGTGQLYTATTTSGGMYSGVPAACDECGLYMANVDKHAEWHKELKRSRIRYVRPTGQRDD